MESQVTRAATPAELEQARLAAEEKSQVLPPETEAAPVAQKPAARLVAREGKVTEKKVPLEFPVEFDGVIYEDAVVRRLRGSDFMELQGGKSPAEISSMMTGLPAEVVDALDGEDFFNLFQACKDFFPRKLREQMEAEALKASLSTHLSSRTS